MSEQTPNPTDPTVGKEDNGGGGGGGGGKSGHLGIRRKEQAASRESGSDGADR